ncbi:hypothetical protein MGS_03243 [Candida albicans P78042]|uniref:Zn(II)2Cys6 transcription factor n=1 Tax=Candida albicans TaxID=5476 RepID=A0A411I6X9_CANAX|nr:hypothetical protein MGS_03243 [Candida albicans P78042]QBB78904.1 Zn(II)2Cys6 transcription factor [Candida albicans]
MTKRDRTIYSCDACRSRKIKCNRQTPCASCHKSKRDCVYTVSRQRDAQITNRKLDKKTYHQISAIEKKISALEGKKGLLQVEAINFNKSFTDQTPLVELQSLFPYLLLSKQDPGCVLVRHHCHHLLEKDPRYFEYSQLLADLPVAKRHHLTARAKALLGEAYIPNPQEGHTIDQLKHVLSLNPNFRFAGNFADPLTSFFSLIPPAWANKQLVDTFFQHIYPVIPIIDETDFNTSINRVLGPQIDGHYINSFPSIGSADDLPFLALFLLVLRISYMYTPGACPVSYDTLRAAETIMKEFDITKTHSLTALQAEIMLRFYKIVAPESYTQSNYVQVSVGVLIQNCYSLALHRDPEYIGEHNPKQQHLRRKIWHLLLRMEVIDSAIFQTILSSNPDASDTKLPQLIDQAPPMEQSIVKHIWRSTDLFVSLRKLVEINSKTSEDTPLETVLELLAEVETKLQAFLATIDSEASTVFYNDLVIFPVNFLLVYMYYSLYLFKGPTPLGNKYLLKSAQILFVDLARTRSTSLFLAYFNLNYIHLVLMITNFLRMRVDCIIHRHLRAQDSSVQDLQCCRYFLKIIFFSHVKELGNYSSSHKYAWQMRKVYLTLAKIMERSSDVLISNDPELVKSAAVDIPVKEINKLLEQYINFKGFTPTTLFDPTDNELIDEMQHENLWNAMENIEYSEKVYSGWIDAIKNVPSNWDWDYWDFLKIS